MILGHIESATVGAAHVHDAAKSERLVLRCGCLGEWVGNGESEWECVEGVRDPVRLCLCSLLLWPVKNWPGSSEGSVARLQ